MSYRRFKASKFKNAAPKPAKHEAWVRDLSVGSYSCYGSYIKSSAAFVAFNVNPTGSQLGVISLDNEGIISGPHVPILNAHSDLVTDFDFSPFEDGLLVTGSADSTIKVWSLEKSSLSDLSTLSPELVISSKQRRVDNVSFNPTSEYLLSFTSQNTLSLFDILSNREVFEDFEFHSDSIISISWSQNGNLLTTCAKDKYIRVIDPRSNSVVTSAISHDNSKDSRVLWLGDSNFILSTGFDSSRLRQVYVRDCRNFNSPVTTLNFDSSTGILLPFYDPDTNMLFLAGRGDSSIYFMEFNESSAPNLTDGFKYTGEQTKGACLVPKRALRVMETEVNRVLQLTSHSLIPIPYHVPRKSYVDFHEDLFPDTRGTKTTGYASLWMDGSNGIVAKTSLNPKHHKHDDLVTFKKSLGVRKAEEDGRVASFIENTRDVDSLGRDSSKKSIPEPLPRKKSISSASSTEEVNDRPVPRPRVNNNGVTMLRTPSSFLTQRSFEGKQGSSEDEAGESLSSSDNEKKNHENNNQAENGHKKGIKNGNQAGGDGNEKISTSCKNNIFENRALSSSEPESTNSSSKRQSVAERLKHYAEQDEIAQQQKKENINKGEKVDPYSKNPEKKSLVIDQKERSVEEKERKLILNKEEGTPLQAKNTNKPSAKRIDTVFGQVSKYRNFKAVPVHKKFHIENLRNISTTCPGESELIQANPERVAVPLNTPGGKIGIFELDKPGRQADGVIPALVHGSKVMDFMWDPFDNSRLVVGCDDGRVSLWKIPSGGLKEQTNEPLYCLHAHAEKLYFVRFHPLAQDVLATGSYDLTVRLWDLNKKEEVILIQLDPQQIQIFSFSWSPCGSKFSTACKDGKIRVYEPRVCCSPALEAKGPVGVRGGRVVWVLDGRYLIVAGFDRSSERQLHMYNTSDLSKVSSVSLDVSPAILVPFYDEDSSILLLSGRGDSTIFAFDVVEEAPWLRPLSHHRCAGAHQGISFLKKIACDVRSVEFAKALRLTESAVEPWSFTVPRVRNEFFQDDLFPPTKCLWKPCMSSSQWFNNENKKPEKISLKPACMKSIGEVRVTSQKSLPDTQDIIKSNKLESQALNSDYKNRSTFSESKKKQEILEDAIKNKLKINMKLEQDSMEGVDEEEWDE